MPEKLPNFLEILGVLAEHDVEFIVIGGLCAVLHGVPINTRDVDIVHARDPANIDRLVLALEALSAHYRLHPKRIVPTASILALPGHPLLNTSAVPLDVPGTLADAQGYDELPPFSVDGRFECGVSST